MANISSINGNPIVVDKDGIAVGSALRAIKTDTSITDFNDVPINTMLSSNTNVLTVNAPPYDTSTAFGFMVITFSPYTTTVMANNIKLQVCITTGASVKEVWLRMKHGGVPTNWGPWSKIDNHDAIQQATQQAIEDYVGDMDNLLKAIGTNQTISDFDLLALNTIVSSNTNVMTEHTPSYDTSIPFGFTVITLSPHHTQTFEQNIEIQTCVVTQGAQAGDIWVRMKHGGAGSQWEDWHKLAYDGLVHESQYFDLSMFPRIAACGDSYCGGSLHTPDGTSLGLNDNASWATQAARQAGCDSCTIYAVGGRGAWQFINDTVTNLDQLIADGESNPYDLVLLEFGINDSNPTRSFGGVSGGQAYIGSSADVNDTDPTQNVNSYWGNMSRIIAEIKAAMPSCRIAVVGLMRKDTTSTVRYDTYNEAARAIAEYHGVLFIDLYQDSYMFGDTYNANIYGGHPTYLGYNGIGRALNRQFSIAASSSAYISQFYGDLGA